MNDIYSMGNDLRSSSASRLRRIVQTQRQVVLGLPVIYLPQDWVFDHYCRRAG